MNNQKKDLEISKPKNACIEYLPLENRFRNARFQGEYFNSIVNVLDASYQILDEKTTLRLFKVLENILPSFYSFKVNLLGNPAETLSEIHKVSSKISVSTTANSSEQTTGSLNSSVNSNLIEITSPKTSENLSDDEEKFEIESIDPKYYEAAVMFHTVPDLSGICDRLLNLFEKTEAGGLHLLYIFIDDEIMMDFKLFQCFILNAFIWGSTPIAEYFDGKEHSKYQDCLKEAVVNWSYQTNFSQTSSFLREIKDTLDKTKRQTHSDSVAQVAGQVRENNKLSLDLEFVANCFDKINALLMKWRDHVLGISDKLGCDQNQFLEGLANNDWIAQRDTFTLVPLK